MILPVGCSTYTTLPQKEIMAIFEGRVLYSSCLTSKNVLYKLNDVTGRPLFKFPTTNDDPIGIPVHAIHYYISIMD
jgi:hypothetical protein